jgi:hypothetical protein
MSPNDHGPKFAVAGKVQLTHFNKSKKYFSTRYDLSGGWFGGEETLIAGIILLYLS